MNIDLPYDYVRNEGALPLFIWAPCLGGSAISVALKLFGLFPLIPWVAVLAPAIFVVLAMVAYNLVRNAVHEGLRMADSDRALDELVDSHIDGVHSAATLTPDFLDAKMREMGLGAKDPTE